jgi:predicted component of type VI protein secretion system
VTAEPSDWAPDIGAYQMIRLGDHAAVVVPLPDFLRLRALEERASTQDLEDAEDAAAVREWRSREAAGQTRYVPAERVRRRLGLTG